VIIVEEILTDLPSGFLDELDISQQQKSILIAQINRFNLLKDKEVKNKGLIIDAQGRIVLPEGTLIHGMRRRSANLELIENIAKTGILTGQAIGIPEDSETFYCADFFRVPQSIAMEEYELPDRMGFTPFDSGKSSMAFIIQPSQELEDLLSYDCYKDGTPESDITKTFISHVPIKDKTLASSILYGIPSNGISGIVIGDKLLENKEMVKFVAKSFPNCYITSKNGYIIYDPSCCI